MNGTRNRMGWGARLLIALLFIIIGAGAAIWGLAHYPPAARILGVTPPAPQPVMPVSKPFAAPQISAAAPAPADSARIAALEQRLSAVENATQRAEGFAGRADALVVAFAARRVLAESSKRAEDETRMNPAKERPAIVRMGASCRCSLSIDHANVTH